MADRGAQLRWKGQGLILTHRPPCQHSLWKETGVPGENPQFSQSVDRLFSQKCHKSVARIASPKACFPLGEFIRANRERSNLIGWQQTLTTSLPNHIRFLLVRAKKNRQVENRLNDCPYVLFYFQLANLGSVNY